MKKFIPFLLIACYGETMILLVEQYRAVGPWATGFRFVAWQLVLLQSLFVVTRRRHL